MEFTTRYTDRTDLIIGLFRATFTDSEGAAEGDVIARLVADMFATVDAADIFVVAALEDGSIVATAIFTRLSYPEDARTVFILSPMAVATGRQGQGLGQNLLNHGLNALRGHGVDVVLTYGDINFYSRVGLAPITERIAKAPLPLQYPEGWLGQSLTGAPLDPLRGPSHCVSALDNPAYW
ncbi:putative acetyltransferase [Rhodovulum marinum]|uniref:Putative acetyltransferase n=2 Tax=Rhodovulum marinum TaxID=320662 RepID=A0A4R2Q5B1_9RHOB|nr:putative acetyltransferase [Rhodovulum marinum]